jgi:hypothetical protein
MCEEGGHHNLRLWGEVELSCARDDERFVDRCARYEWGGREDAKSLLEHRVHCAWGVIL